jgi:hypothetical protein
MAISEEEAKLERFLDWLQVNGGELRGCNIKYSDSLKGFGIFASTSTQASDGIVLFLPFLAGFFSGEYVWKVDIEF